MGLLEYAAFQRAYVEKIRRLEAENARLREERDKAVPFNMLNKLQAENARLRVERDMALDGQVRAGHEVDRLRQVHAIYVRRRDEEVARLRAFVATWFEEDGYPRYIGRTTDEWLDGVAAARRALEGSE